MCSTGDVVEAVSTLQFVFWQVGDFAAALASIAHVLEPSIHFSGVVPNAEGSRNASSSSIQR